MDIELRTIIKELQEDDTSHFDLFYKRCYPIMYKMAYKRCQNPNDAKDIVQESFVEILKSIHSLKYPEAFYLWLSRIVVSKCTRLFRSNRDIFLENEQILKIPNLYEHDVQFLPKESLENKFERDTIHRFVNELTYSQQEVITLIYFEQLSLKEAAAKLQVPIGTIKSRVFQARKVLYKKIKSYEQKEGRNLQFHSSTLAPVGVVFYIKHAGKLLRNLFSTQKDLLVSSLLNTTVTLTAASTIAITVYATSTVYEHEKQIANEQTAQVSKPVMKEELPNFHVEYRGESFDSQKAAYFEIIKWAQQKQHDTSEIIVLYDALKTENGAYYQSLCEMEISTYFE